MSCIKASSLPLAVNVVFLVAKTMVDARCTDTKDHTHTASPTTPMIEQSNKVLVFSILFTTNFYFLYTNITEEEAAAK